MSTIADERRVGTPTFTASARSLGIVSAWATVVLSAAYATTLAAGLLLLSSPLQPVADPWFSIMEILIISMMPFIVAMMVAVHAWAPADLKVFSLIALVFACLLAVLTTSVHFVILTVSRQPQFAGLAWMPLLFSFTWPSVAYALDILAWDVFFAISVLSAAPVFGGERLSASIRLLLVASGVLALAGLGGVIGGDMRLRNIGIAGYVGVFPVAVLLLAILFHRARCYPAHS